VAAKAGLKIALVEKNMAHLGGTCLHNGCIPSKMYLYAAESLLRSHKPYIAGRLELDMARLDEYKEALLGRSTAAIMRQCSDVDLIDSKGELTAPHTVKTQKGKITGRHIVIGTGAKPFIPEGIEYDGIGVITSDEVLNMQTLPQKIAVYGDGAIGLECVSFFAAAGVKSELIWRHDRLLRRAHPMISQALNRQLERVGVELRPNSRIKTAKTTKRGVHIVFEEGKDHYVPKLLVATGRKALADAVKISEIAVNEKGIVTDENFETTLKEHYAIGDCNGKLQLAHAARAQVLFVVRKILGKKPQKVVLENVVKFINTIPCSYAQVGKNGKSSGFKESVVPLAGLPFAHIHDADDGVMVTYADEEGFFAGAEIFAPNAQELISAAAMALAGEMDSATMMRTVLAHPTFSESFERSYTRL
ncbi:MAG: NAD(P)/FAD-dependent oxidoreductase, partial [Hydrogenimonas sp.]|nr:NAD(P)/FAD-dependent oxidoreductase [Hydrogenimonas sp.]